MFPTLLHFFWSAIQVFTAFSLVIPALFCLFYFVCNYFAKQPTPQDELHEEKDYAIIVSANEPLQNIEATLQSLLRLNYSNYIIYVVGNYSSAGVSLYNERIVYLRTMAAYHSQLLLHRFAIESFQRPHTHIAILDGNSIVETNYLTSLNTFFNEGYQAVKARMSLQNNKGIGSVLQTLTDLYRNFFSGEVLFTLGSSSSLSLTGTAFSVSFYKQCVKRIKTNGVDFISNLQKEVIQSNRQVAFASNAVVYNTTEASYYQVMKHHAQHVHDWLFSLISSMKMIIKGLLTGNTNQLVYGLASVRLPLSTCAFIGVACLVVNMRIDPSMASLWTGVLFLLPTYLVTAAIQVPVYKQQSENEAQNSLSDSIILLEPEDNYSTVVQTV